MSSWTRSAMYRSLHFEVQKNRSNMKNTGDPDPITRPHCPQEKARGFSSIALAATTLPYTLTSLAQYVRAGAVYLCEMA